MNLFTIGSATPALTTPTLGRITFASVPLVERPDHILASNALADPNALEGYAGIMVAARITPVFQHLPIVHGCGTLDHLHDGDIVALQPSGYVRTLYRRGSRHNVVFATDHCNSYCLMCSQPPKDVDETGKMDEHRRLLALMDVDTPELGITGGEPTLLGNGFLDLLRWCKERLPRTPLHVLTNGRAFVSAGFAQRVAQIEHPDLMLGIPVYADTDVAHDYIVQARGAFNETMVGLHELGRYGVRVEIRVVLHRLTVPRLLPLVEFLYRNVPFAVHVALMGLEPTGFAVPNLSGLWIDPYDYRDELAAATLYLAARGMHVSIYNHPLCVLAPTVWPFARQSISDWKNIYLPACANCLVRAQCGGFFASALQQHSTHIAPVTTGGGLVNHPRPQ